MWTTIVEEYGFVALMLTLVTCFLYSQCVAHRQTNVMPSHRSSSIETTLHVVVDNDANETPTVNLCVDVDEKKGKFLSDSSYDSPPPYSAVA